jgi:phosphomethylpyrimidine synthase
VDLLCYLTLAEHLGLPNENEVKQALIANKIAAQAGDLVKNRERAIKWDIEMTEERRTLNLEKQLSLSIDPEKAKDIHYRNTGQHAGNNVPCTMCGGACLYLMLPQQ